MIGRLIAPTASSGRAIEIGIGTQNTDTDTGGVAVKQVGLFEKYLLRTGSNKEVEYKLNWQNAASGAPIHQ
jgi:hypothetical protein